MGGEGKEVHVARSSKLPPVRRETAPREDSTGALRRLWDGARELVEKVSSGVTRISQIPGSATETPAPSPVNEGDYRKLCLQKLNIAIRDFNPAGVFWEQDFKTAMKNAKGGFREKRDGSDSINQEICARMLGISIRMLETGKLGFFVNADGAEYLKWGSENLMIPEMRKLCGKMLRKISNLERQEF